MISALSRALSTLPFLRSISVLMVDLVYKASDKGTTFRERVLDESIAVSIREHREVLRVMNHRSIRPLTKRHPELVFSYYRNYLAKSFSKKSRRQILKFHHLYLAKHAAASFFTQILEREVVLWNATIDGNDYIISLSHNSEFHTEGDLRLAFKQNNIMIYDMSFTVVPGHLIKSTADQVLLVANIQGALGKLDDIRKAMRACDRVAAPYLLMTAAESIARTLEIDVIAGVSNKERSRDSERERIYFDYDAFWEAFTVKGKTSVDIYEIPVPFPLKPLEQVKSNQRLRAARKRRFSAQVAASVGAAFAEATKNIVEPK